MDGLHALVPHVFQGVLHSLALGIQNSFFGGNNNLCFHGTFPRMRASMLGKACRAGENFFYGVGRRLAVAVLATSRRQQDRKQEGRAGFRKSLALRRKALTLSPAIGLTLPSTYSQHARFWRRDVAAPAETGRASSNSKG